MSLEAERRPGPGEIWLAVTEHDGVQVDSILIDQAKCGQASCQVRATDPRLQRTVAPRARTYQSTADGASDTASMTEMTGARTSGAMSCLLHAEPVSYTHLTLPTILLV